MSLSIDHIRKMQEARSKARNNAIAPLKAGQSGGIGTGAGQLDPRIQQKLLSMPETMRNTYKRAMTGHSRPAAIKAACFECMGWDRAEVRRCTSPACPLYPYRPGASR